MPASINLLQIPGEIGYKAGHHLAIFRLISWLYFEMKLESYFCCPLGAPGAITCKINLPF